MKANWEVVSKLQFTVLC